MSTRDHEQSAATEGDAAPREKIGTEFFPDFATVRAVLETAQIGIWNWDIAADQVTWSSNLEAIHRLPAGSFDGTRDGIESNVHRDDREGVEASRTEALRTQGAYHARYRLPNGHDKDCWLESNGTLAVEDGTPQRMFGFCRDVTERVNLEAELRSRIKQQEALAQLGERALVEIDIEQLLNDAVSTVAVTLSVDFVQILELLPGDVDLVLRAGFGWKPGLVGTVISSAETDSHAGSTLHGRLPTTTEDFADEKRFAVAPYLLDHGCISGMNATIAGRDDHFYGILGVCTKSKRQFSAQDTSFLVATANLLAGAIARRQLEQRHEAMIRDMRHRSGNLFSQLLALFSQTASSSKSIADLSAKYRDRVLALANAQRLITEGGWTSIPIMELFYVLLAPYLDRTTFNGPNVELEPDPLFNLSSALHELVDNAIKYGSLSRAKGQLELTWSVTRTQRGMTLTLDWVEKNGPPARRPRRIGFGSRLISLVIERQLNGEVTRSFGAKGLAVHMVVPLTRERWPTAAALPASAARHERAR